MRLLHYGNRSEWLSARNVEHRIGGSDVAAILGESPWMGPWDLWRAKTQGWKPDRSLDEERHLARGLRFESTIVREYINARAEGGTHVIVDRDPSLMMQHDEHPWVVGSPDGFVREGDSTETDGGLELKTAMRADGWSATDAEVSSFAETGVLPAYYHAQVSWYLIASGLPWWDVAVLLPWYDIRIVRIHRNEAELGRLLGVVADWRQRHLVEGVEPDPKTSDELKRQAGLRRVEKKAPLLVPDDETHVLLKKWADMKAAKAAIEEQERAAHDALLRLAVNERGIGWDKGLRALVVRQTRRSLDEKRLRADHPEVADLLDEYTRAGEPSAHLRLYGAKGE